MHTLHYKFNPMFGLFFSLADYRYNTIPAYSGIKKIPVEDDDSDQF